MKTKSRKNTCFYLILLGSFILRCIFACTYKGFLTDTACFSSWATRVFSEGFGNFYSPDVFSDYPPGYMYVLYVIGAISDWLQLKYLSGGSLLLLRLPAILCDIATGYIIYTVSKKHFTGRMPIVLATIYLLNPAVFINSSMWGQVDSVFTLTIVIIALLLSQGKTIPSYYVFALGILLKPQTLVFTPLLLYGIYEHVFHKDFQWKKFYTNLLHGLLAIAGMLLAAMPYGLDKVIKQYGSTLGSYPYISVNAYNFWSFWGLNWSSQEKGFLFLTFAQLGTLIIILLTILSAVLFLRRMKHPEKYFLTGSFLIITMFMFSVRMHERYLFPGMILLLMAYVVSHKKVWLYSYFAFSFGHLLNVWHVLYHYDPHNYNATATPIVVTSLFMIVTTVYYYVSIIRTGKQPAIIPTKESSPKSPILNKATDIFLGPKEPVTSRPSMPFNKWDWIAMLGITCFYAVIAFYQLGNTTNPKTEYTMPYYTYLDLTAENGEPIGSLSWYLLNEQDNDFSLEVLNESTGEWTYIQDFTMKSVFSWGILELSEPAKAIRITNLTADANIGELVLRDIHGNILPVQNAAYYPSLFDEADTYPDAINHLSGCYFDEIYYTRTAYEFIHGLPTYENTHPPFGKVLISWSARLLGTTPFGFRFAGALFGVLMLPFMYLLGRNITKNRALGAFVCFIFAFDFMHFTQTRLTTIDVFVTFFIIVMYYFMERYINLSFYDTSLKKTWIPLGACGIAFGFGIASKWTGAYAGAGLAVIFFAQLVLRYREYRYALDAPKKSSNGISHKHIVKVFTQNTMRTILFCLIFFVVIPFIIYLLSYIPFVDAYRPGLFERMLKNQETMFKYHSALEATHPYSSTWIEWPIMKRPIFYYSNRLAGGLRQGISSFGNPLVWWAGIPALFYTAYLAIKKKQKTAMFLCIGFLAQYLPWTLVSRCTFIYHYFPSVPFITLSIGYCFMQLKESALFRKHTKSFYALLTGYALGTFILFLMFYPVISGQPVEYEYVDKYLRWMDSWVFIIK